MKKIWNKFLTWWYFHIANPVVRKGESPDGAFKWEFRRFWLEITTLSGNFKARFMAGENPYAYLLAGKTDDNIIGFCQVIYMVGTMLTTDQGLANEIKKAFDKYLKRLEKYVSKVEEDEVEEKVALEMERRIQEHVELPKKERRKVERDINGRFKKAVKEAAKNEA